MTLPEFRVNYPQYNDMSDAALADALYRKYYSDIDRGEFNENLGLDTSEFGVSGFARGLRDPLDASAQLLRRMLPEQAVTEIESFNNWLVDQGVPLQRLGPEGLPGQLAELEQGYQDRRVAEGEAGIDWARMGGSILGTALPGAGIARAATPVARIGQGFTSGAVGGALSEPVIDPDKEFWAEKAKQWLIGGVGGGALGGVAEGIGAIGRRARSPEISHLREAGIEPTVAQTLGPMASRTEEKLSDLPFAGDVVRSGRVRAQEQFNKAVLDDAVAPIGGKIDKVGTKGIDQAQTQVSQAYKDAADMVDFIEYDQPAMKGVSGIRDDLAGAPLEDAKNFERFMENTFARRFGDDGSASSISFKKLDSDIGKKIRASSGDLKIAYEDLQETIRNAAARQSPEYAQAKQAADTTYAKLVRAENAATRAMNQGGVFTPGQYNTAVRATDTSARKRAIAAGKGYGQEFGELGQEVLGNVVANSGSPERLLLMALGGGMAFDPVIAPLVLGGMAAAFSPPAQRAFTAGMRHLPETAAGPVTGAAGGVMGTDLLNMWAQ